MCPPPRAAHPEPPLQGIVGTMPWNAIAFLTLWLQLLGFSDWHASVLSAAFYGASSAGAFLGGYVGDRAARAAPNAGRITTAQISVRSPAAELAPAPLCSLRGLSAAMRLVCPASRPRNWFLSCAAFFEDAGLALRLPCCGGIPLLDRLGVIPEPDIRSSSTYHMRKTGLVHAVHASPGNGSCMIAPVRRCRAATSTVLHARQLTRFYCQNLRDLGRFTCGRAGCGACFSAWRLLCSVTSLSRHIITRRQPP